MREAIAKWLRYKQERKEPYTDTGRASLLSRLMYSVEKYGETAVLEMMAECMASGYRGLLFDRLDKRGQTPRLAEEPSETGDAWMLPYLQNRKKVRKDA